MSRVSLAARVAAALTLLLFVAGCGGGAKEPLSEEGDVPPRPAGSPRPVDVCALLPPALAASVLGRPLQVVGVEYGPSRVPTLRCMLGDRFGSAVVQTELATGPIAENVFTDAYGEAAGGDPQYVKRFGLADADVGPGPIFGYLRNEQSSLTLHVYDAGSIVSLQLAVDPARPYKRAEVIGLAADIITELPPNPWIAPTEAGSACGSVSSETVGAAIGAEPSAAAHHDGADGSVMCSWAAFPGSATVTVLRSPEAVRDYLGDLDQNLYGPVEDIPGTRGMEVISQQDHAGDLVVIDGTDTVAVVSVVPSAGFADGSLATTPGERELAAVVVARLMPR